MKTILIIEDDREQQKILGDKLTSGEVRVLTAYNGGEGWALLNKENPDLIILDIMLPGGMNGFDLLEMVRRDEMFKDLPVLVLTNLDTEEKTSEILGVSDYLVKANTSLDDLTAKVKTLLGLT